MIEFVCDYFGARPSNMNCNECPLLMRCSMLTIRKLAAESGVEVAFIGDKE